VRGAALLYLIFSFAIAATAFPASAAETVPFVIEADKPVATVTPSEALGGGLDGHHHEEGGLTFKPQTLNELKEAPFYALAYRLRTELAGEVWHWNEDGTWSDPGHAQGYWTSGATSEKPIQVSNGYRLPRRGNTKDQANHDGYSRLSDGDPASFWKSNPYLDAFYTGEDNALNPQWILINFRKDVPIDALRILWSEPYAVDYDVQYWEGEPAEYYKDMLRGRWRMFPKGRITGAAGGDALLRVSDSPIKTNYIRILLKKASGTAPAGSTDVRDRLGFAIREVYAGVVAANGAFADAMLHAPDGEKQTEIVTSSTDPWHRATDRDPDIEQPGIDRLVASGLTRGRPILMPAGLLYDTPGNVAAEVRFLKARGYDVRQMELGEEPDGQNISPEHYGALFRQFADAIHKENPALALGGPGFQSEVDGWNSIPDNAGRTSWMGRFLSYLTSRKRMTDFGFFSFEWYPFDDLCEDKPPQQLVRHPALIAQTLRRLEQDGVPKNIPWIITEYGYSSFAGQAEVELPAALLNAEIALQWFKLGVKAAYLYGTEPGEPILDGAKCETWGNLMMLEQRAEGQPSWKLPTYYGAQLLTKEFFGAADGVHTLYPVLIGKNRPSTLAAYAVRRPDDLWALLVLNKDPARAQSISAAFEGGGLAQQEWRGPHEIVQYSPAQYRWKANKDDGQPAFSNPPLQSRTESAKPLSITLPPMSITVVRAPRSKETASTVLKTEAAH
jgi:hypothetical protein